MPLRVGDYQFQRIGFIEPQMKPDGSIIEYSPVLPLGTRRNPHGRGPFCRFELTGTVPASGVYGLLVDNQVVYIGRCTDLSERFGPLGHGAITARNCHHDGQSTNCKINAAILRLAKTGKHAELWFHRTDDFRLLEKQLIALCRPAWNGRGHTLWHSEGRIVRATPEVRAALSPSLGDFSDALVTILADAARSGLSAIVVTAADLHRRVGGYPGPSHRMPSCCTAMRRSMTAHDRVLHTPRGGKGGSLKIWYRLPR